MTSRASLGLGMALLAAGACTQVPVAPTRYPGFTQSSDRPTRVMTPMRDGKRMATDIYLPAGAGPWPVLLQRTPDPLPGPSLGAAGKRDGDPLGPLLRLYENGYAIAFQTARGRFDSEGEAAAFGVDGWGELQDGYDAVEWLARRPWCDGRVGTFGASGPGIAQYQMAGSAPPHLVAQHIGTACADPYGQSVFQGGAYRLELVENRLKKNGYDYGAHRKLFGAHPFYDGFWRGLNLNEPEAYVRTRAPALHWSGWWDIYAQGAIDAFCNLQHRGGPGARGRQRLILGPWPHGIARRHGDLTFPENALHPPHMDLLEWFDYTIRGLDRGFDPGLAVVYYTIGAVGEEDAPGNAWRTAGDWPPVDAEAMPLFLAPDGALRASPPPGAARREFAYDPRDPVPTLGGANLHLEKGAMDQRPIEGRPDVLLFTSPPLARPLEATGRVTVKLWVSTSAKDTDFTAKLTDVYPDGRSILLLDGIRRLRFRYGFEKEEPAVPGAVFPLEIDLWTTSVIFNAGHRVRVAISSSNAPRFQPNPNTGGPPFDDAPPVRATNAVHIGPATPSCLVLPVAGEGPAFAKER